MNLLEKIKFESEKFYKDAHGSHDADHVDRVYKNCLRIGEKEGADMEVLQIAAILHDIGRQKETESQGAVCHAEYGAQLAREILDKFELGIDTVNNICHAIESHRFRNNKIPRTLEAKVLFDADKLDSIGAVGIGRAFLFAGEIKAKLHNDKSVEIEKTQAYTKEDTAYREFMVKLKYIKDKMLTNEGRQMAENRHNYMVAFFERLNHEIDGLL
jgi:uncharacterized protein